MDWMGLKDEHKLLKQDIKRFAATEVLPQVPESDKKTEPMIDTLRKLAGMGVLGILVSEEFGGVGMDLLSLLITVEELAKVSPSLALSVMMHNLISDAIFENGTEEQKKEFLSKLAAGKILGGLAVDTMHNPLAQDEKDERMVVNGAFADVLGLHINKNGEDNMVLLKGVKDLKAEREISGMRSSGICSFAPEEEHLGKHDFFTFEKDKFFAKERLVLGAIACGISLAVFDYARSYSKERHQFGRAIAEFGMVREMLSDMVSKAKASELLVYEASQGNNVMDMELASTFAVESSLYVTDKGVQIYGGYGYTKDYPMEMFFRDAKVLDVLCGSIYSEKVSIGRLLTA